MEKKEDILTVERERSMKSKVRQLRTNLPFLAGLALLYALLYVSFVP